MDEGGRREGERRTVHQLASPHSPEEEQGSEGMKDDVDQMEAERMQSVDPVVCAERQDGQWPVRLVAVDLRWTREREKERGREEWHACQ